MARRPSTEAMANAQLSIAAEPAAAVAMLGKPFDGTLDMAEEISALALTLQSQPALTQAEIEQRLSVQMVVLDSLFYRTLAEANGFVNPVHRQGAIELALKVQKTTRQTALALDTIRNPKKPTQFIRNYVDKQLNALNTPTNQLKEGDRPHAQMDTRSAGIAAPEDSAMEAVAAEHGAKDRAGQKYQQGQLL